MPLLSAFGRVVPAYKGLTLIKNKGRVLHPTMLPYCLRHSDAGDAPVPKGANSRSTNDVLHLYPLHIHLSSLCTELL